MGTWIDTLMGHSGMGQLPQSVAAFDQICNDDNDAAEAVELQLRLRDADEVTVRRLPEQLNSRQGQAFMRQIQKLLKTAPPHLVFDASQVRELDAVGIHLLLLCLEEAMKCNGDIKLAAIPDGPSAILASTGVADLFEIFDSTAEAAQSFHRLPLQDWSLPASVRAREVIDIATAGFAAD